MWNSDQPMTLGQLLSKRDEFWDTAPAFNGRQEIWQALRAAAECEDTDTAQAIMSAVDVTYVLCAPIHATHGALTILSTLVAWVFTFIRTRMQQLMTEPHIEDTHTRYTMHAL